MAVLGAMIFKTLFFQPEIVIPPPSAALNRPVLPVIKAPISADSEIVPPRQFIDLCGRMAAGLMVSLPGWNMNKFNCSSAEASFTWNQTNGTLNAAKEAGFKKWPETTRVSLVNRVLTASLILDKLPKLQPENMPLQEAALLILEQELQPVGALKVTPVKPVAPVVPPPTGFMAQQQPAPPAPPAPPPYLDIELTTGFSPDKLVDYFDYPGFEVKNIEWQVSTGDWKYKMKWMNSAPKPPAAPVHVPPVSTQAVPAAGGAAR